MINITLANTFDLEEILDLQQICYQENAIRYNDFNISPLTQTIEALKNDFDNGIILKAIVASNIVGSIRAFEKDNTCYIGRLIVHPKHQNKGIGSALLHNIEKAFGNVSGYDLFTGHRDDKNLYLYQKLGYQIYEQKDFNDVMMIFLQKKK